MSLFTEVLSKLKPKNWQQGNHFFLLDSHYVEFAYQPTVNYPYGSIVTYQGKFYQRNQVTAGYNPGIAPTNSNYWIAANPGRDLGDYSSLADLQATHPEPAPGSIATVEDEDAFYKWDNDNLEWKAISGSEGLLELSISVHSDDHVSSPILFVGRIKDILIHEGYDISAVAFQAKTDGGSYTYLSSTYALQSWIDTNIVSEYSLWYLEVVATFTVSYEGETSMLMQYKK
ncbi:hypothetical protein [Catalinimonas niigatensis]|uniref:hypothetical protein n=1 Tax=Catalinimonas niigatensis TaxID=1397264 RepID=UPI0026659AFD|nr:hypothetical protein [Catalinimonas niigatensis]WPP48920.1 hypothetical protein PZB72_19835 [Catalinimonas niigatensis]WPP49663.1 hypothetical protein PZB72_23595 [Catalinimonas niigatensis]